MECHGKLTMHSALSLLQTASSRAVRPARASVVVRASAEGVSRRAVLGAAAAGENSSTAQKRPYSDSTNSSRPTQGRRSAATPIDSQK